MSPKMETWVTRDLAEYNVHTNISAYPDHVIAWAKNLILDNIGCMVGGNHTTLGKAIIDPILAMGGAGEATVIGTGRKVPVTQAALANGTSGNALDYDDTAEVYGHPGSTIVSTSLAVGQKENSPGADLLAAVINAYEVGVRIAYATWGTPERMEQVLGMGTWPAMASVIAAGKLMGLDLETMLNALGVAGATAPIPNTQKWGWEPEERPIHWVKESTGWPSWCGTMAALLAANGFLGNRYILDGDNGFWIMSGSDRCQWDLFTKGLGEDFTTARVGLKPYSSCRWQHAALDAISQLLSEEAFDADEVKEVVIHSFDWVKRQEIYGPKQMVDAQFCIPHSATMLLKGIPCGPEWYARETLEDQSVVDYSQRIRVVVDSEMDRRYVDEARMSARVEVFLNQGRRLERYVDTLLGNPDLPLSNDQIKDKFRHLAGYSLNPEEVEEAISLIDGLEDVENINQLTSLF